MSENCDLVITALSSKLHGRQVPSQLVQRLPLQRHNRLVVQLLLNHRGTLSRVYG